MKKSLLPVLIAALAIFPTDLLAQNNDVLIRNYISGKTLREYKRSDLTGFVTDNTDSSKSLNGDVVKIQQTYKGFPIFNAVATALIKNGKIVYFSDNFIKDYQTANLDENIFKKQDALNKIAELIGSSEVKDYKILNFSDYSNDDKRFVKQRSIYIEVEGHLKFAYEFILREPKSPNSWDIIVDAKTGNILHKENLNLSCTFHPGAYGHEHSYNAFIGPVNKIPVDVSFFAPNTATYNVFPLPVEAPTFGNRAVLTNPWMPASSPEGWHSDGTTHYTTTRGNNIHAYEDSANMDTEGFIPDGGASRNFDFPFSIYGQPLDNQSASITNLFYVNNRVHDILYKFGFTESARNFQQNNFGNGGLGNDYVETEAQDGGGLNNANFGTLPDGNISYMQMYLWSSINQNFFYNSPSAAVPRQPLMGTAQFGPGLTVTGVTANVQLTNIIDGCTALTPGSLTGKIGLVERGTCNFSVKVKNAQNAGASAVIIYNNAVNGSNIGNMAGNDPTVTIPSVIITNEEGEYIKTQLNTNTVVNVTLKNDPSTTITPDGSFDNGIVAHEYGHGISTRLTGNGYSCLSSSQSKEQMGEGWSDFYALLLTNKPGDNASVARGVGTYAQGEPISGGGIRPAKYSPDFIINNYTYGDTNGMEYNNGSAIVPNVHSIGFTWATMLWDLNWEYVSKYGYASDVTSGTTSGSARVLQLVTDALKLQACNPTFIDGRNAILTAEMNTTAGADRCMIWRTFAKRGLGINASAGLKANINDQTESFDIPGDCVLSTSELSANPEGILIYPNPAKNEFFVSFPSSTIGKVNLEIYDMSGKLVSVENRITPDSKKSISTDKLTNGIYLIKLKGLGFEKSSKIIIKK